ncbi:low molecular weight protein-tyrosine-phosphatase [Anaeromyxobacter paludicola]|uniref:protein-tyrosine-phosphatase n=1 Tax=Anaeromyxobacter paludicola TaxID=2918171 RepID=A0ABM7XCV6_9BACT|nr:low molecular weight protein-tyrosine-phosphatase [Anaeromyxobacter paludicola]BDG09649.1 protein-tyrosine-phosphatase [Anaeromyxobacter paludicola]
MFTRLLTVCIGNICRSPMAEALLRAHLEAAGKPGVRVQSAGLAALVGRPADPLAQALLAERGIDLSQHRARQLTSSLVTGSDLVLVMDEEQQRAVEKLCPTARGRVQRLGRFGKFDVPDPYGGSRAHFEEALRLIDRGIADFARVL